MDRAHALAQALLLAACAWLPACGLNQAGVPPPQDTIAYPASAVLDRNGDWLIVTSSNADLRYNDGTLMALSLSRALIDRTPNDPNDPNPPHPNWGPCDRVDAPNPRSDLMHTCCWDSVDNNILNCDERHYVGSDAEAATDDDPKMQQTRGGGNVRIGSFAAGMVLQRAKCPIDFMKDQSHGEADCDGCATVDYSQADDRLMIGVRGDTSLTWVDLTSSSTDSTGTPPRFNCTADPGQTPPSEAFAPCDDNHRIIQAESTLAQPTNG